MAVVVGVETKCGLLVKDVEIVAVTSVMTFLARKSCRLMFFLADCKQHLQG